MGPRGLRGTSALPLSLPFGGPWEFPLKGPTAARDTGKAPGSPWRLEGREERAFGLRAQKRQGAGGGGQPAGPLSRTGGLRLPGMYPLCSPLLSSQGPDPTGLDPTLAPITSCRTPSPIPSLAPSHYQPQRPLVPLQPQPQSPPAPSHHQAHAPSPSPIPSSAPITHQAPHCHPWVPITHPVPHTSGLAQGDGAQGALTPQTSCLPALLPGRQPLSQLPPGASGDNFSGASDLVSPTLHTRRLQTSRTKSFM